MKKHSSQILAWLHEGRATLAKSANFTALGFLGLALGTLFVSGCSDDDGSFSVQNFPQMVVEDSVGSQISGESIFLSSAGMDLGDERMGSRLRIRNIGSKTLKIHDILVSESTPSGAFRLTTDAAGENKLGGFPREIKASSDRSGDYLDVYIFFKKTEANRDPVGVLTIESNTSDSSGKLVPRRDFTLQVEKAVPTIQLIPDNVNFGAVRGGETKQQTVNVLNQGTATLQLTGFVFRNDPDLELIIGTDQYTVTEETTAGITFDEPIVVRPGEATNMTVRYSAADSREVNGELILFSNDPRASSGIPIPIKANVGGPCVKVNPNKVAFGAKFVGRDAEIDVEIESCGDMPLEVTGIALVENPSGEFRLNLGSLPSLPSDMGELTETDRPLVLNQGERATFSVIYTPEDVSGVDETGAPVKDKGKVLLRTNTYRGDVAVEVEGLGTDKECPTPIIIIEEGEEVVPQTKLHLIGSQSYAETGTVEQYEWKVSAPRMSNDTFRPGPNVADPTFEVNMVGKYVFRLEVTDSLGEKSCQPAEATVLVNPDDALHIELLWDAPGADMCAPGERGNCGTDLDLHFTHPYAVGHYDGDGDGDNDGWFDGDYDCYWFNNKPNWGSANPDIDDNPRLDRDDLGGGGPENLNLNAPEEGITYRVGVHYWDDHGNGISEATVRVFIYGSLMYEVSDMELLRLDMWSVTNLTWPPVPGESLQPVLRCSNGLHQSCTQDSECGGGTCEPLIVPNYNPPPGMVVNF